MTDKHIDLSIEVSQVDANNRRAKGEFVRGVSQFRSSIGDPDVNAD